MGVATVEFWQTIRLTCRCCGMQHEIVDKKINPERLVAATEQDRQISSAHQVAYEEHFRLKPYCQAAARYDIDVEIDILPRDKLF